uniref:PABS domain-containing protein n=1 Tax=Panagrellus redivivus TaxID=6233 RepID=A0A7E4W6M3_PANRE
MLAWLLFPFLNFISFTFAQDEYILKPISETWIDDKSCTTVALVFSPLQNTTFAVVQESLQNNITSRALYVESNPSVRLCAAAVNYRDEILQNALLSEYSVIMIMAPKVLGTVKSFKKLPKNFEILDIGLGCGTFRTFWRSKFTSVSITSIEFDPAIAYIAKTWYGAVESNNSKIIVADGVEFVKTNTKKYDAIFLDACTNSPDSDLICPDPSFLKDDVISQFRDSLKPVGCIVMNCFSLKSVGKDILIQRVKTTFERFFKFCFLLKVKNSDFNKVLACTNGPLPLEGIKNQYVIDYFKTVPPYTLIVESANTTTI